MKKDLWALEYSVEQDAFYVNKLDELLEKNLYSCLNKISNDYKIIFIGSEEQCRQFYKQVREKI